MKWISTTVALLLLVAGCQSNQSGQGLSPEKFTMSTGETTAGGARATTAPKPLVIVPGAVISITVEEDRSLNRAYTVPGSGVVNYPPVGRIAVEGRSPKEIAEQIKKSLEKEYFPRATVTVTIESAPDGGAGVIYVIGNVNRPGPVVLPKEGKLSMTRAISSAGDLTAAAAGEKVQIVRYDDAGKKHVTYVNATRIMKGIESDIALQNGDWIIVP
jgi:protein involved in polysaccharide export with SLBB domain